jgi:hypothetical protein
MAAVDGPLAIGIAIFAVVTPGMFGGFVIARLAIGSRGHVVGRPSDVARAAAVRVGHRELLLADPPATPADVRSRFPF